MTEIDKPLIQYNSDRFFFLENVKRTSTKTNRETNRGTIDVTGKFEPTILEGLINIFIIQINAFGSHINRINIIEVSRITMVNM